MVLRIMFYIAVSPMHIYAWETLMVMCISSRPHRLRVGLWLRTTIFFLLFYTKTDYSMEESFTLSYSYGLLHWHFFLDLCMFLLPCAVAAQKDSRSIWTFSSLRTLFLVCKVNYSNTVQKISEYWFGAFAKLRIYHCFRETVGLFYSYKQVTGLRVMKRGNVIMKSWTKQRRADNFGVTHCCNSPEKCCHWSVSPHVCIFIHRNDNESIKTLFPLPVTIIHYKSPLHFVLKLK